MRRLTIAVLAAASILTSVSASALTAKQSVEKETVVQLPDGTESITRGPAELVIPGERVVYTLSYTNDDAAPATDLVLTMPVPSEIKYMDGSATLDGASVVYSADHGKTFASRTGLRVLVLMGIAELPFQRTSRISAGLSPVLWPLVKLGRFLTKVFLNN